jgi:hypothetical protein
MADFGKNLGEKLGVSQQAVSIIFTKMRQMTDFCKSIPVDWRSGRSWGSARIQLA